MKTQSLRYSAPRLASGIDWRLHTDGDKSLPETQVGRGHSPGELDRRGVCTGRSDTQQLTFRGLNYIHIYIYIYYVGLYTNHTTRAYIWPSFARRPRGIMTDTGESIRRADMISVVDITRMCIGYIR